MKIPVIRESYLLNSAILIISLALGWFGLYYGLGHLLNPSAHTPSREPIGALILVIGLTLLGLAMLFIALLALQGIIHKFRHRDQRSQ